MKGGSNIEVLNLKVLGRFLLMRARLSDSQEPEKWTPLVNARPSLMSGCEPPDVASLIRRLAYGKDDAA
jgi:hypothetical protein